MKPARAGAAGIEIEDTVFLLDLRLMAVAVDHDAKSGRFRLQVELAAIVQHVDGYASGFDDFGFRQRVRP